MTCISWIEVTTTLYLVQQKWPQKIDILQKYSENNHTSLTVNKTDSDRTYTPNHWSD